MNTHVGDEAIFARSILAIELVTVAILFSYNAGSIIALGIKRITTQNPELRESVYKDAKTGDLQ